jgi:LDH2 family malate/lactate/ureidoglycolate dehydrogenase
MFVAAWFGLVTAAEEGRPIRGDIAYDAEGNCTTSAADALKGALRVFDRQAISYQC